MFTIHSNVFECKQALSSGGFRVVPRVPWNPSFMKVLIILYYDKLTRSVGPVDYNSPNGTPSSKIIMTVAHK